MAATERVYKPVKNLVALLEVIFLPLLCVAGAAAVLIWVLHWDPSHQLTRGLLYLVLSLASLAVGGWKFSFKSIGVTSQGILRGLAYATIVLVVTLAFVLLLQLPVLLVSFSPALLSPVLFYLAVALGEEIWFRGLMFQGFSQWKGPVTAVICSVLVFGLFHVPLQGWHGVALALSMGLPFAVVRLRANNIIGLIFAHWLIDLVDSFFRLSAVGLGTIWVGVLYVAVFGGLSIGLWRLGHGDSVQKST
jgi:membrane protease YdiL (CAAX protease family)